MADKTTHFGFNVPGENENPDAAQMAENFQTLDAEVFRRGKRINGVEVNESGDFILEEVPYARNLLTNEQQMDTSAYLWRTTGGENDISSGEATMTRMLGQMTHSDAREEVFEMELHTEPRESGAEETTITAEIDKGTFLTRAHDPDSIELVFTYTEDGWDYNHEPYGITVSGVPVPGDRITVDYTREDRGVIVPARPTSFHSTGWNLYNHETGYARVKKYSETYDFLAGGTYTGLKFSKSPSGVQMDITVSEGHFSIAEDGYVWVTGGNGTDTYICMTKDDWTDGPDVAWEAYHEDVIDLGGVMANFPYGLCRVGEYADEIDFASKKAVRRIDRIGYSKASHEALIEAGTPCEADREYIYFVLENPIEYSIEADGKYTADAHGMEMIDGTSTTAPTVRTVYGENLADKIQTGIPNRISDVESNVRTLQQLVSVARSNITALQNKDTNIQNDITTLQRTLQNNYSSLSKKTDTLQTGYNTLNTDVATLRGQQTALSNKVSDMAASNAGAHNAIYRGKFLGTSVTAAQYSAISSGTFDDLYLGDYWTIGGHNWVICDFDYYIRCGEGANQNKHHLIMMPSGNMSIPEGTALYGMDGTLTLLEEESATEKQWNPTSANPTYTTAGGYKFSRMRTVIMKAANTIVINAFGAGHVIPFAEDYYNPSSALDSGLASGFGIFNNSDQSNANSISLCDLCNETMVYGQQVWGRGSAYTSVGFEIGYDKYQLAIFALQRDFAQIRSSWWLRSVATEQYAAAVEDMGGAGRYPSGYTLGVRPRFLLG